MKNEIPNVKHLVDVWCIVDAYTSGGHLRKTFIHSFGKYLMSTVGCGQGGGREELKGKHSMAAKHNWEDSELAVKPIGCREPPDGVWGMQCLRDAWGCRGCT